MRLRDRLIPELIERYSTEGPIPGEPPDPIITFPARHAAFGDVTVFDDGHEITIVVGAFTHMHIADYDDGLTEDERTASILGQVHEWLDALFDDRVIVWGTHEGGGGCEWFAPGETLREHASRSKGWVWSGPWERSSDDL